MEKRIILLCALGLAITSITVMSGCSSSKPSEDTLSSADQLPVPDAQTDAVPVAATETPAALPVVEEPKAQTPPPEAVAKVDPPAATPAPAAVPPPAESKPVTGEESYTVQDGDTLMKIAYENFGDLYQWKKILEDNKDKITNANTIPKGTVLKISKNGPVEIARNGEKYLIQNGDTLGTISSDVYGTKRKWRKLWENNKQLIKDPNRIFAGFYLYYSMTPEEKIQADELKKGLTTQPAPLAESVKAVDPVREPSSSAQ